MALPLALSELPGFSAQPLTLSLPQDGFAVLKTPLNRCASLKACILQASHHKAFLSLFHWFWSPLCTISGARVCFPKHVPRPQPQHLGFASGLWRTDLSPIPAVTHSSPASKTKDDFGPFVTHCLISLTESLILRHSQPVLFLDA